MAAPAEQIELGVAAQPSAWRNITTRNTRQRCGSRCCARFVLCMMNGYGVCMACDFWGGGVETVFDDRDRYETMLEYNAARGIQEKEISRMEKAASSVRRLPRSF